MELLLSPGSLNSGFLPKYLITALGILLWKYKRLKCRRLHPLKYHLRSWNLRGDLLPLLPLDALSLESETFIFQ